MRIEINPRSLLNLEHICEVLYKLHPYVLDELVEMQRLKPIPLEPKYYSHITDSINKMKLIFI